jgi:hypothetical protein
VKEVDAPQTLSNASRERLAPARIKRVGTTNVALSNLEMLDKTVDVFSLDFLVFPMMHLFKPEAASNSNFELEDTFLDSEVKVIQSAAIAEEKEDEDEVIEIKSDAFEKRQVSMSTFEHRQRLQEWRQGMLTPRL